MANYYKHHCIEFTKHGAQCKRCGDYNEGLNEDCVAEVTHEDLLAEVNDPEREDQQRGTPAYRLNHLFTELDKRFPDAVDKFSSSSQDHKYLEAIDKAIANKCVCP